MHRKRDYVDEDQPAGQTREAACRSCGRDESPDERRRRDRGDIYQVVVACAACGSAFVAISRN